MPDKRERKLKKLKKLEQQLQDDNSVVEKKPTEVEIGVKISEKTSVTGAEITNPIRYHDPYYVVEENGKDGVIYGEISDSKVACTTTVSEVIDTQIITKTHNREKLQNLESRLREIAPEYRTDESELNYLKGVQKQCKRVWISTQATMKELDSQINSTKDPAEKARLIEIYKTQSNNYNRAKESYDTASEELLKFKNDFDKKYQNSEIESLLNSIDELNSSRSNKEIAHVKSDVPPTIIDESVISRSYQVKYKKDFLDLQTLKDFYNDNGKDAAKTYQFLTDFIKENKDNQDVLQHTISSLLDSFGDYYDHNINFEEPAGNIVDTFDKILNLDDDNAELKGFMCSSIHSTMMQVLNDCGFPAVIISGSADNADITSNHATLLYKNSDGEYVFCDYGRSSKIVAPSIVDAIKEVHKNGGNFLTNGFITINGKNNTYKRFELENVAAWGKELADKGLMKTPGSSPMTGNAIRGNLEQNADGKTFSAGVTFVNQNNTRATSLDIQGKKLGESDIFNNSESIGVKCNIVRNKPLSDRTTIYSDNTAILTYTTGQNSEKEVNLIEPEPLSSEIPTPQNHEFVKQSVLKPVESDDGNASVEVSQLITTTTSYEYRIIEEKKNAEMPIKEDIPISSYLGTGQYSGNIGLETEIVHNPKLNITSVSELDANANLTAGNGVDGVISSTVNQGIKFDSKVSPDLSINGNLFGGITMDVLDRSNYQGMFVQTGFKGTAGVGLDWKPAPNLDLSTALSGGVLTDATSTATGCNIGVQVSYKPTENSPLIFGNVNYTQQKEQLHLGNFNETIKNNKSLNLSVGTKFKNSQLSVNYNKYNDALHPNQSGNSWTATYRHTL